MTRSFLVGGEVVSEDAPDLEMRLKSVGRLKERPLCLCGSPGLPLYVAQAGSRLILKRMPLTGSQHDPTCSSYETPPELSGRGEVQGSAIEEDVAEGTTRLKLGFSLSKRGKRAAVAPGDGAGETARTDGAKLTLRGLLHFLWEEAELNQWAPGMAGRRTWAVVRHRLLAAAASKAAKGVPLAELLFVPETFAAERKADIAERRGLALKPLRAAANGPRPLMVLIGEVKEIAPARFGHKLVVKHLPDMPLMLGEDIHRRLKSRFEAELELADGVPGTHLLAIASFGQSTTGVASVEEIALMVVTEQWIPIEHTCDGELIAALSRSGARFVKGLRYNLARTRPLACAVLPTTRPRPTALYVVPPGAHDSFGPELQELVAASELASWIWEAGTAMPPLPACAR